MQRLEVSCAVQPIYGSLGAKRLSTVTNSDLRWKNVWICWKKWITTHKQCSDSPSLLLKWMWL